MTLAVHLAELSEKHKALDRRIMEESTRPSCDDNFVAKLKREKLRLKEEITRLTDGQRH